MASARTKGEGLMKTKGVFLKSIKSRILFSFMIILLLCIATESFQVVSLHKELKELRNMRKVDVQIGMNAGEMKLSIVEIQQLLTDMVVTGNRENLTEVKKYNDAFLKNIDEIINTQPEEGKALLAMKAAFMAYEELGTRMVDAYLKDGKDAGDKTMVDFDAQADQINKLVDAYRDKSQNNIDNTMKRLESSVLKLDVTVGVTGTFIFLIIIIQIKMLLKNINGPVKLVTVRMREISEGDGDLTLRIAPSGVDELDKMIRYINNFIANIEKLVTMTKQTLEKVTDTSKDLNVIAKQNMEMAEAVTCSGQEVSSSVEEQVELTVKSNEEMKRIADSIKSISSHIVDVVHFSNRSMEIADYGKVSIKRAMQQMESIQMSTNSSAESVGLLKEKSEKIDEISQTIIKIAKQTNLLALNASIEAARAGENGRGFVVVAEEIKKLAEETSHSSDYISKLISEIQIVIHEAGIHMNSSMKDTEDGVAAVKEAGTSFNTISDAVKSITKKINKVEGESGVIANGIAEISIHVEAIAMNGNQVNQEVAQLASSTEEQLASMESLSKLAYLLNTMAKEVKKITGNFKVSNFGNS